MDNGYFERGTDLEELGHDLGHGGEGEAAAAGARGGRGEGDGGGGRRDGRGGGRVLRLQNVHHVGPLDEGVQLRQDLL